MFGFGEWFMRLASFASLLCLMIGAKGAAAQSIETRAGPMEILEMPGGFHEAIQIGDQIFFEEQTYIRITVMGQRGDLILLQGYFGAAACAGDYFWLHATPGDIRLSERFGTCAGEVEITHGDETVTVIMASQSATDPLTSFVYDGEVVREVGLGQSASFSPPANGGLPWEGHYAYELFRASDWRPALVEVMGEDGYRYGGQTFNLSAPMERQGNWVVGTGCRQHDCGDWRGAIALHVTDGRILVAINDHGNAQFWGKQADDMPPMIADVMAGQ